MQVNNLLKFLMQLYFKPTTAKMLSNLKVGAQRRAATPSLRVLCEWLMRRCCCAWRDRVCVASGPPLGWGGSPWRPRTVTV